MRTITGTPWPSSKELKTSASVLFWFETVALRQQCEIRFRQFEGNKQTNKQTKQKSDNK